MRTRRRRGRTATLLPPEEKRADLAGELQWWTTADAVPQQHVRSANGRGAARRGVLLLIVVVLLVAGAAVFDVGGRSYRALVTYFDDYADAQTGPVARAAASVRQFRATREHVAVAPPVHISVPAVSIDSDLERLGREDNGAVAAPSDWDTAGWYRRSAKPGQRGASVILGHVDSTSGPAIFYRLRDLRPGDEIRVTQAGGGTATFAVERLERHAKAQFPTTDVYLPTPEPTLRLITCDGTFDREAGSYRDNLVVFATLAP